MAWTEQQQAALVRLAGEGLTASEIGARIGMTRNAVIGRCWRKGVALPVTERKLAISAASGKSPSCAEAHRKAVCKLSDDDVLAIRRRALAGEKQGALAVEYGVSSPTISLIKSGRTWRHLLPPPAQTTPEQKGRG